MATTAMTLWNDGCAEGWKAGSDLLPDQVTPVDVTGFFTATGMGTATMLLEASILLMALALDADIVSNLMRLAATPRRGCEHLRTQWWGTRFFVYSAPAHCVFLPLALCSWRPSAGPNDLALTSTPSA
jgi:hypothetical protein